MYKKTLIILLAAICLALPVATFVFMPQSPDNAPVFSENENRYLATFVKPDFSGYFKNFFNKTPNNIKNKQFMNGLDSWFADRFVLREDWIILQNELETLRGMAEINGVFLVGSQTSEGVILPNPFRRSPPAKMIQAWRDDAVDVDLTLGAVDSFAQMMQESYGVKSYIMLVPTAGEIYKELLPPNSQQGSQSALINYCYDNLPNLASIGVTTYLTENANRYIYYRTDHHWTTFGSYWGYYAAAKSMGIAPYDLGRFNVEHASSDFRGTLFSKTLNYRVTPDVIQFFSLNSNDGKNNPQLHINDGMTVTKRDSLYLREFLDKKDKYAAFMGLNSPIMDVYTDVNTDKTLLIFKDSFAHCMIPFLANHYSRITVLDMRYINADIRAFVELGDYEQVLFVYSATNFAEDTDLWKLNKSRSNRAAGSARRQVARLDD